MLPNVPSSPRRRIDSSPLEIEVNARWGQPAVIVVGLPDGAVKESRDRVKTVIENSGFKYVMGRTTINLAPADVHMSTRGRLRSGLRQGITATPSSHLLHSPPAHAAGD